MSCMVCRKCDVRLFNVGSNYGKINHTVGDDFREIYGDKVIPFLNPDSCVCNVCMNILDNVTKLIRSIWNVISDPYSQPQPSKLSKFWKIFASLKLEGDDIDEVQSQDCIRTPTPNLLVPSFSVPYNVNLEGQIAEIERSKSMSRASTYMTRPESDTSEVQTIFHQRKGSRGRSRSFTSSGYGRSKAHRRETTTPCSEYSNLSTYTTKSSTKRRSTVPSSAKRTSTTLTRSVSRAQAEEEEKRLRDNIVYCSVTNCNMFSDDIEEMNIHNVEEHQMALKYHCYECSNVYTSEDLFNHHMKYHNSSFFCLMCGVEQQNILELQKHLDEHMIYSVPCKYCDKSFLSKTSREHHIEQCHKGKRKRRIYKEKLILDRIDKEGTENVDQKEVEKEFQARYLFYTDMECEEGDTDITVENLQMRDIPVHTDEDEGITMEDFRQDFHEIFSEDEDCTLPQAEIDLNDENVVIEET